jgi:hypothetical protein
MPSLAPFGQAVSEEKIFLTLANPAGHSFYIGPIVFFYYQVNDTGS